MSGGRRQIPQRRSGDEGAPRIVIDANIFVSAFLFGGKPGFLLDLVDAGSVVLVHCDVLHDEIERTLRRKFGWSQEQVDLACREYWESGIFATPAGQIHACADPNDDYLLECAVEG